MYFTNHKSFCLMDLNLASVKHPLFIKAIAITVKADNFLEDLVRIFS